MADRIYLVDGLYDDMYTYTSQTLMKCIEALEVINDELKNANNYISNSSISSSYNFTHTDRKEKLFQLKELFGYSYAGNQFQMVVQNLAQEVIRIDDDFFKRLDLQIDDLSNLRIGNFKANYTGGELNVEFRGVTENSDTTFTVFSTYENKSTVTFDDLLKSSFGRQYHAIKYKEYFDTIYKPDGHSYVDITYDNIMQSFYKVNEFEYNTRGENFENGVRKILAFTTLAATSLSLLSAKLGWATLSSFFATTSSMTISGMYFLPAYKFVLGKDFDGRIIDRKEPLKEIIVDAGIDYVTSSLLKYRLRWANADEGVKILHSKTYSSWDDFKAAFKGEWTAWRKANKPLGSPDINKWFKDGGTITLDTLEDGTYIWRYTQDGITVPYVPKIVNGKLQNVVEFPDEYLYKTPEFDGEFKVPQGFTGNRELDKNNALKYLLDKYGYTEIPDGYILHHDIENGVFQIVRSDIHKIYSHYGGHHYYNDSLQ